MCDFGNKRMENRRDLKGHQKDLALAVSVWEKVRKRPRRCMFPRCEEKKVIDSHSITQSMCLKSIAEDGWVYQPRFRDIGKILRRAYSSDVICPSIERIEISKASVFNWYCADHDNELFKHIDVAQLEFNNPQQVRELYLRTMSRNMANLEDGMLFTEEFDRLKVGIMGGNNSSESASRLAYDSDMDHLWKSYWNTNITGVINWYWRVVPGNLGVAVSAMYPMAGEKNAEEWYYYCNARPMISLSIIPQFNNVTHVVFAWWYEWDEIMRKLKVMLEKTSEEEFLYGVNRIVATELDGFCVSPKIWNRLTRLERMALEHFQQCEDYHDQDLLIPQLVSMKNSRIMKG